MGFEEEQNRQNMIAELRRNMICASLSEAERMADGIISTDKKASSDIKEMTKEVTEHQDEHVKKKDSKVYLTKQEFDSLIKINNKIIEANFVKLKNYTDSCLNKLSDDHKELKCKLSEVYEQPVQTVLTTPKAKEPATASKDSNIDMDSVSIEKMFYYGNK